MTTGYTDEEVEARLAERPSWRLNDGWLQADLTFADFAHAMLFAVAVGHLAEQADHHPDLLIHRYKRLRLRVKSHDVDGITDRDFGLIDRIDALPR